MGGVTSFYVTVSDNLETCFQVRNGPFNTTKWHTQECIHRPHLLEPASTGLFVQEKLKTGDGASFLPIPPPGQPELMNSMARLVAHYCFLWLLGTFVVRLVPQLLLDSLPLDLVSTKQLNKLATSPSSKGLKHMLKFKPELQTKCVFNAFCKQGLNLQKHG